MTAKPPIFIELCAGTAALSLRLQGGRGAKPPVSRMGAKTGYADAILGVLGLYPGLGAESYLWCEPDDGVRGLLMAYAQPEVLRAAAAILRSWKDEEPRALWERLRAELKAGVAVEGAEGVARFCVVVGNAVGRRGGFASRKTGKGDSRRPYSVDDFAVRVEACVTDPHPPTFIARDGRSVTPEEVARLLLLMAQSVGRTNRPQPFTGFSGPGSAYDKNPPEAVADRVLRLNETPWPPVTIVADGRMVSPYRVAAEVLTRAYSNGDTPGVRQSWSGGYRGPGGEHGHTTAPPDEVGERLIEMAALRAETRSAGVTPPTIQPNGRRW